MRILDVKPFKQSPSFCGPASLKMVLAFFGIRLSEKNVARLTKTKPYHGTPGPRIVEGAARLGLKAFYQDYAEWKDLEYWINKKRVPVIMDWFSEHVSHFSVAVGIDKKRIAILDPEDGKLKTFPRWKWYMVWFSFTGSYYPKTLKNIVIRRMIVVEKPVPEQKEKPALRKKSNSNKMKKKK